jgi:hypothetical protein
VAATDVQDAMTASLTQENPMFRKTILGLVAAAALLTTAVAPASAHYYGGYGYKSYGYGYKSYGYSYYKPYYGYRSYNYYGGY